MVIFKPRYDVAIVAVFQYGERFELLAGERSMTCSMLEAGFDRTYDGDPSKDMLLVKSL